MTKPLKRIRPEIMRFAERMELIMRANDSTKGDSWKKMNIIELETLLAGEWKEYVASLNIKELVDIANFCMMIWNRREKYL